MKGDASQGLRKHVERITVVILAYKHLIGQTARTDARRAQGEREVGFRAGIHSPLQTLAIGAIRELEPTFAAGVAQFYLRDVFVPREVLSYGDLHSREGVIELKVGLGGLVACGILYFARAGHHKVDLVGDVRLDLEIEIRGAAICGGRESDAVGRGGLGIDRIEAGIALSPGPLKRSDQGTGSVGGGTVEPFGAAHRKAGRRAAIAQRTKAGVDGGFHAGPCTRLGQHGVDALGGSFDQAGVGQTLHFKATRGQVFTRKALCLLAGNDGSTRGGGTLRLGQSVFLRGAHIERDVYAAVTLLLLVTDIVVGTGTDGQTGDAGQHGGKASMKDGIGMFHCCYSLLE